MDQIWKWITDNWVNALSLTLAVIGVVLAVIFYLRQRNPKSLDYTVRSVVRVISPAAGNLGLVVAYSGVEIDDPYIAVIRIANTGKVPISAADFNVGRPITFAYSKSGYWNAEIVATSDDLSASDISIAIPDAIPEEPPRQVELVPQLLNPNEWFDLQLLSEGLGQPMQPSGRFAGQARPMKDFRTFARRQAARQSYLGLILLSLGFPAALIVSPATGSPPTALAVLGLFVILGITPLLIARRSLAARSYL